MIIQCMFKVAISPLMFSPGFDCGEFKSMRLSAVSVDPLIVDGPGTLLRLVGGERWATKVVSPAEAWEDDAEKPASLWATEPELPPSLCGLFLLLLLRLRPLLG